MAKRAVQLQQELNSDEDLDNFLFTSGLLVIEVYSDWCGPCLGMLGALRRVKLDIGDGLSYAIAKSDTITAFNRFNKKSEPTWLFVWEGQATNLMFGTDAPKLSKFIYDEYQQVTKFGPRYKYAITELQPEEVARQRVINEAKEAQIEKERREKHRKRMEHFNYVTDTIEENLPDIGVTIFGPHINRDTFRKIMDFGADKFGIQCKDRRNQPVTKEQFDFINTICKNPLHPDVIDEMDGKDLFICFWKIPEKWPTDHVPEALEELAHELQRKIVHPPDAYREVAEVIPPMVSPIKTKVTYELPEDVECPPDEISMMEPDPDKDKKTPEDNEVIEEYQSEMGSEEDEEHQDDQTQQPGAPGIDVDLDFGIDTSDQEFEVEEEEFEELPKVNICTKTITIPGIWVPKEKRTHAALIYVLFRTQTMSFLPPDPPPEPPHLIMAFPTYKQRDLIDFAERYKDDVPFYGYFTSDDADEAKFIANSKQNYARQPHSANDKLVFKVNKRTSHTMLTLVTYGPTYVSFNTDVGHEEALKFFPESYMTPEMELAKLAEAEAESKKEDKEIGKDKEKEKEKEKEKGKEKDKDKPKAAEAVAVTQKEPSDTEGADAEPMDENAIDDDGEGAGGEDEAGEFAEGEFAEGEFAEGEFAKGEGGASEGEVGEGGGEGEGEGGEGEVPVADGAGDVAEKVEEPAPAEVPAPAVEETPA